MSSYKIYLTKSSEVAHRISKSYLNEEYLDTHKTKKKISTGSGAVNGDVRIPAIYHSKGLFYCIVEYQNGETWDKPEYEIVMV